MAAPTIVAGHTTFTATTTTSPKAINAPTHQAGDVIYIACATDGDSSQISCSGFSEVYSNVAISTNGTFALFKKTAGASEPASYDVAYTVTERACMVAWAVRNDNGVHATGTNASGSGTTVTLPAVTTSIADCLRISIAASAKAANPTSTATGHTEMEDVGTTSGGSLSIQYKALPSSGTDGSQTVTQTTTDDWVGVTFAIAPTSSPKAPPLQSRRLNVWNRRR